MYFTNIHSLADLKKQYRQLAKANHPDLGGSEEAMKAINAEFDKLFEVWEHRTAETDSDSEYTNDYKSATSKEYRTYVYNEYKWCGNNFAKTHEFSEKKICEHVREFLKETYPNYKFSVNKSGWNSVNVYLMKADFHPYKDHSKVRGSINHYHLDNDNELTDRAKEVFANVISYVQSWNFDDSDMMTDYFHVNFYPNFKVGGNGYDFKYEPILVGSTAPKFVRRTTPTEALVKKAMGAGNAFHYVKRWHNGQSTLDETHKVLCKDNDSHYPLWYSQPSLLKKRMIELVKVGVIVKTNGKEIELVGYTDELQAALQREKEAEDERERKFYESQQRPSVKLSDKANEGADIPNDLQIIDYSEKAIAVTGSTKGIADKLKELGGRFNPRLSCGAGWIFSKRKESELRAALGL